MGKNNKKKGKNKPSRGVPASSSATPLPHQSGTATRQCETEAIDTGNGISNGGEPAVPASDAALCSGSGQSIEASPSIGPTISTLRSDEPGMPIDDASSQLSQKPPESPNAPDQQRLQQAAQPTPEGEGRKGTADAAPSQMCENSVATDHPDSSEAFDDRHPQATVHADGSAGKVAAFKFYENPIAENGPPADGFESHDNMTFEMGSPPFEPDQPSHEPDPQNGFQLAPEEGREDAEGVPAAIDATPLAQQLSTPRNAAPQNEEIGGEALQPSVGDGSFPGDAEASIDMQPAGHLKEPSTPGARVISGDRWPGLQNGDIVMFCVNGRPYAARPVAEAHDGGAQSNGIQYAFEASQGDEPEEAAYLEVHCHDGFYGFR